MGVITLTQDALLVCFIKNISNVVRHGDQSPKAPSAVTPATHRCEMRINHDIPNTYLMVALLSARSPSAPEHCSMETWCCNLTTCACKVVLEMSVVEGAVSDLLLADVGTEGASGTCMGVRAAIMQRIVARVLMVIVQRPKPFIPSLKNLSLFHLTRFGTMLHAYYVSNLRLAKSQDNQKG